LIRDLYVSEKRIWLGPPWETRSERGRKANAILREYQKDYALTIGTRDASGKVGVARAPMLNVMVAE
jgi:hypothetical protein